MLPARNSHRTSLEHINLPSIWGSKKTLGVSAVYVWVCVCVCVLNDASVLLGRIHEDFVDLVHPEGLSFTCRRGIEKINHGNIWSSSVIIQVYHTAMVLLLLCDNATSFFGETCLYLPKMKKTRRLFFFLFFLKIKNAGLLILFIDAVRIFWNSLFEASSKRDPLWPTIVFNGLEILKLYNWHNLPYSENIK